MDCSPPGSSIHGILQARILEWVAISFSRGSSRPRDWTWVSCIGGRCFYLWARPPYSSQTPGVYSYSWTIESVMPSNHLILYSSLILLPSIFPSIRVYSNELALHIMWPKYWSFSFSISPSNEYSGQISFKIDWLDLLAVQGTLKSLLQHYSSKASILRR